MRYGHGSRGLIGITLNESAMKRWPPSLHVCSRPIKEIADVKDEESVRSLLTHKEKNGRSVIAKTW